MNIQNPTASNETAVVARRAIISRPADRQWFNSIPGERIAIRIHSADVGGRYTILEQSMAPMTGPPMHIHQEDEVFEVLQGTMTFVCGDERFEAEAGTIVVIPAQMPHTWANLTDEQTTMRTFFSPGGLETMFTSLDGLQREALEKLAASFGSRIVGPGIVG